MRWPFIIEGLLIGVIGSVVTLLLLLASAPISDLARAIAGQVPVGFSESLTTQLSARRRRGPRARWAGRLDQRARLPAQLIVAAGPATGSGRTSPRASRGGR